MQGVVIRDGVAADVESLLAVEARAATLLLDHGGHDLLAMHALSVDDLLRGIAEDMLRVAQIAAHAVGFALAGKIDGHAHLFELSVDPAHGRRGIGSALLESVCESASARGFPCISLVTLRQVPWNAPFYARRGFVELGVAGRGPALNELTERERVLGIDVASRVVMRRAFASLHRAQVAPRAGPASRS